MTPKDTEGKVSCSHACSYIDSTNIINRKNS